VSLSSEPAFSYLKDNFVCGYRNIANEKWAGASGKHQVGGNAVDTTNGAGPHNIQMFVMTADGTVLTVLPGYWHAQDLVPELKLAQELNKVWTDPSLSREQKDQMFRQMQLAHIEQHSKAEHNRSHMQGFDVQYEVTHRLYGTDVFYDPRQVDPSTKKAPPDDVKTTDIIMHERMAQRPFLPYNRFDVVAYADYGKPFYDKHEDQRMANGQVAPGSKEAIIGNDPRAHPVEREVKKDGSTALRTGLTTFLRYGLRGW
jgi:Ca2+-binding RTX toxin-like protein